MKSKVETRNVCHLYSSSGVYLSVTQNCHTDLDKILWNWKLWNEKINEKYKIAHYLFLSQENVRSVM